MGVVRAGPRGVASWKTCDVYEPGCWGGYEASSQVDCPQPSFVLVVEPGGEAWGGAVPMAVSGPKKAPKGRKVLQFRPQCEEHSTGFMKIVQVTEDVPGGKEHAPSTSATHELGDSSRTVPELGTLAQGGPLGACRRR